MPLARQLKLALMLVLAALLLNNLVGILLLQAAPFMDDARDYFEDGLAMVQGVDNGKPHYWPPGGPYVLSAFMGLSGLREPSAAQGLMSLVSALTTGLVFLMAQALFWPLACMP